MTPKNISEGIVRAVITIFCIIALLYGLYLLKTVIIYLVVAVVVALICRPLVLFFKKKLRFKNTLAVITTIFLMLLLLTGIISSFVPLLVSQGKNLSVLDFENIHQTIVNFLTHSFEAIGVEVPVFEVSNLLKIIDFNNFSKFINAVVSFASDFGMGLFSVIFISFFFLKDGTQIGATFLSLVNEKYVERTKESIETIKNLLSRYFVGLLLQLTIIFVFLSITLIIFGVKDAFIIAFLCALLNLIPYIGPLIGGALIAILTMSSFINADFVSVTLPKTIYVLIGFLFTQLIDNLLSQPLIFSNSVKSNPLEIFLVILVCGTLFGIIGMVVAVPAYTVMKVFLKVFFAENKFIKILTKDM